MKAIVVYFSRRGENYVGGHIVELSIGNTEVVAKKIATKINARLVSIEPQRPYPQRYKEVTVVAMKELHDQARPAIIKSDIDLNGTDIIFLGYPNWWGTMPMCVKTFLEANNCQKKTIVPFCTHEGSRFGRSLKDIEILCPDAQIIEPLSIRGSEVIRVDSILNTWLARVVDRLTV